LLKYRSTNTVFQRRVGRATAYIVSLPKCRNNERNVDSLHHTR